MNYPHIKCGSDISGVFVYTTLQPTNYEINQQDSKDGQKEPTGGPYFPSNAFQSFLRCYTEELGMSFAQDQRWASVAINTCAATCENEVLLF